MERWIGGKLNCPKKGCPVRDIIIGVDSRVAIVDGQSAPIQNCPTEVTNQMLAGLKVGGTPNCENCLARITQMHPLPATLDRSAQIEKPLQVIPMADFHQAHI